MQYLLIHAIEDGIESQDGRAADSLSALNVWLEEVIRLGVDLQGSRLGPASDATTVRVRGGEVLLTDGPFAETKEQVAGYDILECENIDDAVGWAAQHPTAHLGSIEVRPLFGDPPRTILPEPKAMTKRYLLIVCVEEGLQLSPEESRRVGPATEEWVARAEGSGARLYGSRLEAVNTARTVRRGSAQVIVTDGPFAETKEQIAGFDVLECADLDEALDLAAAHPVARFGAMEVRPLWPFDDA